MNNVPASSVLWRRLMYMLTPQLDIYESIQKIVHGKRVLEIGFGTGLGTLQYHAFTEYVDAVEIDSSAVQFARQVLPLRNVRWLHDDISNPSKTYRGYDLLIMVEVLEHIVNIEKTLMTLKNSLRKGGSGLITVPNSRRYRRRQEVGNVREWTPPEFKFLLLKYFESVWLLDSGLMPRQDNGDTRESPLIAGVYRGR